MEETNQERNLNLLRTKSTSTLHGDLSARAIYSVLAVSPGLSANKLASVLGISRKRTLPPALKVLTDLGLIEKVKQGYVALEPPDEGMFHQRKNDKASHWSQTIAYNRIVLAPDLTLPLAAAASLRRCHGWTARSIARRLAISPTTAAKAVALVKATSASQSDSNASGSKLSGIAKKYAKEIIEKCNWDKVHQPAISEILLVTASTLEKLPDANDARTVFATICKDVAGRQSVNMQNVLHCLQDYSERFLPIALDMASTKANPAACMTTEIRSAMGRYLSHYLANESMPTTDIYSDRQWSGKHNQEFFFAL